MKNPNLENPMVAIYRTTYRLASESFIKEQALSLKNFSKIIWTRDMSDMARSENEQIPCIEVVSRSIWARLIFTVFGIVTKTRMATISIPAIIHAHFGPDGALIMPFAKRHSIPLILTCHGFDVQRSRWDLFKSGKLTNLIYLLREKQLYSEAKVVIAVSNYLKLRLIERGCPAEKIRVQYIGVDINRFARRRNPPEVYTIANIGRHAPVKGVDVLIKALAILVKRWPCIKLIQIGLGSDFEKNRQLADSLGLGGSIEWHGAVSHENIPSILNRASVYIQPSITDVSGQAEAFGIAVIEAQALGIPAIVSNSGGLPEAVLSGKSGILVKENDPHALAGAIEEMLTKPALLLEMSNNARAYVERNYNISERTVELEQIYQSLINKRAIDCGYEKS